MNILVAPDSFKECLSAKQVAKHITTGILDVFPNAKIHEIPISDGGEGLLDALMQGIGGVLNPVMVKDPLQRDIQANFGILKDGTAVIEMAKASGLELLSDVEKNPMITSTYGTGQLIKAALDKGCKNILVGIGGSATNDAGTGMLRALGCKFLDANGNELKDGGGYLDSLSKIDLKNLDKRLQKCKITVACDVDNPLTGPNGASYIYASQKGATAEQITQLDNNLKHFAYIVRKQLNIDIKQLSGGGAAGGIGAGLSSFLSAELKSGIDLILETLKIEEHIKKADIIFTGEGKVDKQTLRGKTITGIAKIAKKHNVPVVILAGKVVDGIDALNDLNVTIVHQISDGELSIENSIKNAGGNLESSAAHCLQEFKNLVK